MTQSIDAFLKLDLETRSRVDLLTAGAYKYADDESTEVICIGWSLGTYDGVSYSFTALPLPIRNYIINTKGLVAAFNAQFDRLIWEACAPDDLQIAFKRWYCVAAQCRVNAIPGALNDAYRALNKGDSGKDIRGPQLIRALSIPRDDGTFNYDQTLTEEMGEYCLSDVRSMIDVMKQTRLMTTSEHYDYLVSEQINENGIEVDMLLATLASKYAAVEMMEIAEDITLLTNGEITKHTQVQRITKWVLSRLPKDIHHYTKVKKKGKTKTSMDKRVRANLLALRDDAFPINVRAVLECLDDGNKSSVAKFKRMIERAEDDDRVRGAFIYAGASQTLRYASRGLQLHNFKRDCFTDEETEDWITQMDIGGNAPTMEDLGKMLRPCLVPTYGHLFVVGDWSSVEAGALPWLSLDGRAHARLSLLRDGGDLYANTMKALQLSDRQLGKVVELSMGFAGGAGAFAAMAQNYGVVLPEETVEAIVRGWRAANQWAVDFWNALEAAAKRAVRKPETPFSAGRIKYVFLSQLMDGTLVAQLPCGATIQYPQCRIEQGELTALKASFKPAYGAKEWPRVKLWRGLLVENVTQATCASLLRTTLLKCDEENLTVVAHVHDEVVLEVPVLEAKAAATELQKIMETQLPWSEGLPLIAPNKIMSRYGK